MAETLPQPGTVCFGATLEIFGSAALLMPYFFGNEINTAGAERTSAPAVCLSGVEACRVNFTHLSEF